jgi:hypothetical protein
MFKFKIVVSVQGGLKIESDTMKLTTWICQISGEYVGRSNVKDM